MYGFLEARVLFTNCNRRRTISRKKCRIWNMRCRCEAMIYKVLDFNLNVWHVISFVSDIIMKWYHPTKEGIYKEIMWLYYCLGFSFNLRGLQTKPQAIIILLRQMSLEGIHKCPSLHRIFANMHRDHILMEDSRDADIFIEHLEELKEYELQFYYDFTKHPDGLLQPIRFLFLWHTPLHFPNNYLCRGGVCNIFWTNSIA